MIIIGCGGSGGKTVQMLRHSLNRRLERSNWNGGFPAAWQLLYIDTPTSQEAPLPGVPSLPSSDYISLSEDFPKYDQLLNFLTTKADGHLERLEGWIPEPPLQVPLREGAGQMRALGRAVGLTQYGSVASRVGTALASAQRGVTELAQLSAVLEPNVQATPDDDQDPFVVVISSMAGGTGAGIFIDICDVVRAVDPNLTNRIMGVLFTAEVFRNLKNADGLQPNSLAVISELMSGQFEPRPLEPTFAATSVSSNAAVVAQSGPSYPFVVGMSTLAGKPLELINDCYRSVSETLLSMMTSSTVSHKLTAYVTANWESEQQNNFPAWSFGRRRASRPLLGWCHRLAQPR